MAVSAPRSPRKNDPSLQHPRHPYQGPRFHRPRQFGLVERDKKYGRLSAVLVQARRCQTTYAAHRRRDERWRPPRNGVLEIASPARDAIRRIVARYPKASSDPRRGGRPTPMPDIERAPSRSARSYDSAKRGSAASVSTSGSAGHRQRLNPGIATNRRSVHGTHFLFAARRRPAVQRRPRGSSRRRRTPRSASSTSTSCPNIPSQSIKGVLVECRARRLFARPHASRSAFIYATVLKGAIRSQVNDGPVTVYEAGQELQPIGRAVPSRHESVRLPAPCSVRNTVSR